jgi:hypothetical protein
VPEMDLCEGCPEYGLLFYDDRVLPAHDRKAYNTGLNGGLDLLDQAGRAKDAATAAQLRTAAWAQFATSAAVLDGATVRVGAAGVVNPQTGKLEPEPFPWLWAAGQDLTAGVALLVTGQATPQPAIDLFDAARRKLTLAGQGPLSACPNGPGKPPCMFANYLTWDPADPYTYPVASLTFGEQPALPSAERARYLDGIEEGLALLHHAGHANHPEPLPWRELATEAFLAAASWLPGTMVTVTAAGPVDPLTGTVDPQPMPWLEAAGAHLAAGMTLLGGGIPMPEPAVLAQAMAHFDAAYKALVTQG